jgi:hypothetical protein
MVIKASSATEIRALVDALCGPDEVKREAAIARLAVIGPRAVDRLTKTLAGTSDRAARVAILRALEAVGDHRAAPAAQRGLDEGGDVAIAAAGVLRSLLDSPHGHVASKALDSLVAVALDERVERRVRVAALQALDQMPADVREKVAAALGPGTDDTVREQSRQRDKATASADALWRDALDGLVPDDPDLLRAAVSARAATAPLGTLQKLIDEVRRVENDARGAGRKEDWRAVRGAIHHALALRGSRVAVYDLRESFAEPGSRLPVSFLSAVQAVGDRSCLEPLAATLSSAASEHDQRWQHQLAAAFRAIARREKITRRHAVMRRISARWPHTHDRVFPRAAKPSSS